MFYDRHYYLHSEVSNRNEKINMMNMVRDPVNRVISSYYYIRRKNAGWFKRREEIPFQEEEIPSKEWFEKDFNECVKSGDLECQNEGKEMQVTYFCGSDLRCKNSSDPMVLQVAKYNLEHRFSVVGVMEHYNISIAVLEAYLPAFFRGASMLPTQKINGNHHPEPESDVREILKQRLKLDYELYEFAKQRLFMQWKKIEASVSHGGV